MVYSFYQRATFLKHTPACQLALYYRTAMSMVSEFAYEQDVEKTGDTNKGNSDLVDPLDCAAILLKPYHIISLLRLKLQPHVLCKMSRKASSCVIEKLRQTEQQNKPVSIQVLWELDSGKKVWWDGIVRKLQLSEHRGIQGAVATIRYKSCYGYKASTSLIKFKSDQTLVHSDGGESTTVSWRLKPSMKNRKAVRHRRYSEPASIQGSATDTNMKLLRTRISETSDKLNLLSMKIEAARAETGENYQPWYYRDARAKAVMAFLRHRVASQMQKSPRHVIRRTSQGKRDELLEGEPEGILRSYIRARVDCELSVFEKVAQHMKINSSYNNDSVQFIPPYPLTQLPSQGSTSFEIVFKKFSTLCKALDITSTSDRLEMLQRYGVFRGEGSMRLLGSYCFENGNVHKPAHINVGFSCDNTIYDSDDSGDNSRDLYHVLIRQSRAWNLEDRRYENPLHIEHLSASRLREQECFCHDEMQFHRFLLRWRRATDLATRTWSRNLASSELVVGQWEVVLPCLIVSGSVLCDEITSVLTDDVLQQSVE